MNKDKEEGYFVSSVNAYGLPHAYKLGAATGRENVIIRDPELLCQMYWRLRSIRVRYVYSGFGESAFLMECAVPPVDRVWRMPYFEYLFKAERKRQYGRFGLSQGCLMDDEGVGFELAIHAVHEREGIELSSVARQGRRDFCVVKASFFNQVIPFYFYGGVGAIGEVFLEADYY